jgi:cell pole-organizing protein PopZ
MSKRTNTASVENIDATLAAISAEILADEALNDADTGDLVLEEPANDEPDADELHLEEIEGELAISDAKAAAYAEAPATGGIDEEPAATPTPKRSRKKSGDSGSEGVTKTSRTRGTLADLPAENFILVLEDAEQDLESVKASVIALRPTAVKIGEKFDNLFLSIAAGKKPSIYTMHGFNAVKTAGATGVSGPEMVKVMQDAGFSLGTARSQAQQIMTLLQATKIASMRERRLYLNEASVLADALAA